MINVYLYFLFLMEKYMIEYILVIELMICVCVGGWGGGLFCFYIFDML